MLATDYWLLPSLSTLSPRVWPPPLPYARPPGTPRQARASNPAERHCPPVRGPGTTCIAYGSAPNKVASHPLIFFRRPQNVGKRAAKKNAPFS